MGSSRTTYWKVQRLYSVPESDFRVCVGGVYPHRRVLAVALDHVRGNAELRRNDERQIANVVRLEEPVAVGRAGPQNSGSQRPRRLQASWSPRGRG